MKIDHYMVLAPIVTLSAFQYADGTLYPMQSRSCSQLRSGRLGIKDLSFIRCGANSDNNSRKGKSASNEDKDGPKKLTKLRKSKVPIKNKTDDDEDDDYLSKSTDISDDDISDDDIENGNEVGIDVDIKESDFAEASFSAKMVESWKKTPPITKAYITASIVCTLGAFALNKNQWPQILSLDWPSVLYRFQIWRPFTAFLYLGDLGLNFLLTVQLMWTYLRDLERQNHRAPADFLLLLLWGSASLLAGYAVLGFSPRYLGHNLSCYLVYIWSRSYEGNDVNIMDLFVVKAELLPWFFVLQGLVVEKDLPIMDIIGIVIGHVYYVCYKKGYTRAPGVVQRWLLHGPFGDQYRRIASDFTV